MKLYKFALVAMVSGLMAVSCSDNDSDTAPSSNPIAGGQAGSVSSNGRTVGASGRYTQASGHATYTMSGQPYNPPQCGGQGYRAYEAPASPQSCQMSPYTPPPVADRYGQPMPYNGPQLYKGGDGRVYTREGSNDVYRSMNNDGYMNCGYEMVAPQPCPEPEPTYPPQNQGYQNDGSGYPASPYGR